MRLLVQRVSEASVIVDHETVGKIERGLLVFLGINTEDTAEKIPWCVNRLCGLRIFPDHEEKMNLSVQDVGGGILVVSQFTLYGDCSKGMRPGFVTAAPPEVARPLYHQFVEAVSEKIPDVQTGRFQAKMSVNLINDGPITLLIER